MSFGVYLANIYTQLGLISLLALMPIWTVED